jgi:tetratricopeptide (TPR) repeat protein
VTRLATLLLLLLLFAACDGGKPTGGGSDKPATPKPPVEVPTPPATDFALAAKIDALEPGDLASLLALFKAHGEEGGGLWQKHLPALAEALADEEMADLLLAAPVVKATSPEEHARAWDELSSSSFDRRMLEVLPSLTGESRLFLGLAWLNQSNHKGSRSCFGLAVALGLPAGIRDVAAGMLFLRSGNLGRAEEILRGAADRRAYGPYAEVLLAGGATAADALAGAESAFPGGPVDVGSKKVRLRLLTLSGDYDGGLKAFEELRDRMPEDPDVFTLGGDLFCLRREPEPARVAFERAFELGFASTTAHARLAVLLFASGNREAGFAHLEAALAAPAPSGAEPVPIDPEDLLYLSRECTELALRGLGEEGGEARAEELLGLAATADPTLPLPFLVLSEMKLRAGDLAGATAVLEEGSRPVSSGDGRAGLLLRLAVRRLMGGDLEGYEATIKGISRETPAGRLVARFGSPAPGSLVLLEGRPAIPLAGEDGRHAALAAALFGPDATAADHEGFKALLEARKIKASTVDGLDIRASLAEGIPVLVETISLTDEGAKLRFMPIVGHDAGLGAYFLADPDPRAPVVLDEVRVRGGLFYRIDPEPFEPADEGQGVALAQAFAHLEKGELTEAFELLPKGRKHPISDFIRSRGALLSGRGVMADKLVSRELTEFPEHPVWHLLKAQVLLVNGDQSGAAGSLDRVAELSQGFSESLLYRRLMALTRLNPETEEVAIAELRAILVSHPEYLPVYQDLSGIFLSRRRFAEAFEVLEQLAREDLAVQDRDAYRAAVRAALSGLASVAESTAELEPLFKSDDPKMRVLAVRVAPRFSYKEAIKSLTRLSKDEDQGVRALTIRTIGERRYRDAAEVVRGALKDEVGIVRGAAARALRSLLDREAMGDLIPMLEDEDIYVREVAFNELQSMSGKDFGFDPRAPEAERGEAVRRWEAWAKER